MRSKWIVVLSVAVTACGFDSVVTYTPKAEFIRRPWSTTAQISDAPKVILARLNEIGGSLAGVGAPWEPSDVILDSSLPRRRVKDAGFHDHNWFIHYEHGGRGKHEHLFAFQMQADSWVYVFGGVVGRSTSGLSDLVLAVQEEQFCQVYEFHEELTAEDLERCHSERAAQQAVAADGPEL